MKAIIEVAKELANRAGWVIGEVAEEPENERENSFYDATTEVQPRLDISYLPGIDLRGTTFSFSDENGESTIAPPPKIRPPLWHDDRGNTA